MHASFRIVIVASFAVCNARAFSTGAGGCQGGMAAVMGQHLDTSNNRIVSSGNLASANVTFQIDDVVLESQMVAQFEIGRNYKASITAPEFPIRGGLIRIEAPDSYDTSGVITPDTSMQDAFVCIAPVVGTTHFNRENKNAMDSIIRFDEPVEGVIFDITAVFINTLEGSVFVYDQFIVNFIDTATSVPVVVVPSTPSPSSIKVSASPSQTPTVHALSVRPTISITSQPTERRQSSVPTNSLVETVNPVTHSPINTIVPTSVSPSNDVPMKEEKGKKGKSGKKEMKNATTDHPTISLAPTNNYKRKKDKVKDKKSKLSKGKGKIQQSDDDDDASGKGMGIGKKKKARESDRTKKHQKLSKDE